MTEADNPAGEEVEEERLARVLKEHRDRSPREIRRAVTRAVTEFSAGGPVADDLTLVVAKMAKQTRFPRYWVNFIGSTVRQAVLPASSSSGSGFGSSRLYLHSGFGHCATGPAFSHFSTR